MRLPKQVIQLLTDIYSYVPDVSSSSSSSYVRSNTMYKEGRVTGGIRPRGTWDDREQEGEIYLLIDTYRGLTHFNFGKLQ